MRPVNHQPAGSCGMWIAWKLIFSSPTCECHKSSVVIASTLLLKFCGYFHKTFKTFVLTFSIALSIDRKHKNRLDLCLRIDWEKGLITCHWSAATH